LRAAASVSVRLRWVFEPPRRVNARDRLDGAEPVGENGSSMESPSPIDRLHSASGEEALMHGAWAQARDRFEAELAQGESAWALIGLGIAARYQFDAAVALESHEAAFRLARQMGDAAAAGRAALELVIDCGMFRGPAEAGGWLERATRVLDGVAPGPELGMLTYMRARFALVAHDLATARELAHEGVELARLGGSVDGEMICLALEGLAAVADGNIGEGMRRLDEATTAAVSGEIADAGIVEVVCCHLIDACRRVRDFDRAGEWCRRVEEIATRFDDAEMFATCRTLYGEVLVWQGKWGEAERTLRTVCRDFAHVRSKADDGLVRLAELRRRQGRPDDAAALLAEIADPRIGAVVGAALALDRGDARGAAAEAERFLRGVGERDRFERVRALELLVRARLALGDRVDAEVATEELEEVAAGAGTKPLTAAAQLARGRVEAEHDPEHARASLEDAADLFTESGVRYEAAQARLELAAVLRTLGNDQAAAASERAGRSELAKLGAAVAAAPAPERTLDELTRREREVLALVAKGRSNDEIASELVLSVRTVEHHVTSIYSKIGASGRAARAAATAYALSHGLAGT
jgi:DNA-binding NarL/FixJ family response regulator